MAQEDQILHPTIDKSTWGPGPWQDEPDRVDFTHAGLTCLALRGHHGVWCGYVAVPPGHPLHGTVYQDIDVQVHGGLTYSQTGARPIGHVPAPGDPDAVWWIGFDCGHDVRDRLPGMEACLRAAQIPPLPPLPPGCEDVYRDLPYVRGEIRSLADQLAHRTP